MGKVYTREELEGIRDRVLIQAKAFYESQGRMPSIRELLDITGVTQHAIYKVFGGKAGIEDALNEGSTREEELPKELKEKRAAMIDCTKEFFKKHGRLPSNTEILSGECGFSLELMYRVFGSKRGLKMAVGIIEPEPEPEPETHLREKPFRQETYAQEQKAETLAMVPGIDLSKYAHCTRLGDRHGL